MLIYVDIDDTICNYMKDHSNLNYHMAIPIQERINMINGLYDKGHIIVYWTARGAQTGIDWSHITKEQLNNWGCKYHELRMNKPSYDLFVDDKNINSDTFFDDPSKFI